MTYDLQVDVTGDTTGTAYTFQFRLRGVYVANASGGVLTAVSADWRVTGQGGIVADTRNGSVRVFTANGTMVAGHFYGPTQHGLFLSGGLGIQCPGT